MRRWYTCLNKLLRIGVFNPRRREVRVLDIFNKNNPIYFMIVVKDTPLGLDI